MATLTWQELTNSQQTFLNNNGVNEANTLSIEAKNSTESASFGTISRAELTFPLNATKYLVIVLNDTANLALPVGGQSLVIAAPASEWLRLSQNNNKRFVSFDTKNQLRLTYTEGVRVKHQTDMRNEAGKNPNFLFQRF